MHTKLPIFFFHQGAVKSLFFNEILKQAELTNGLENIYVLTDSNFDSFEKYNCINISDYMYCVDDFNLIYKHHSLNKYSFEKACFDRWFIINEIIKKLNINFFVHADCDVLILEDLKPVYKLIIEKGYEGSTMFFENGLGNSITSGHSSFWSDELIDDFCNFVCHKYSNNIEFEVLLKDTLAGKFYNNTNVSDMILLDLFRTETLPKTLNLLTLEENDICFDFNINASYNGFKNNFKFGRFPPVKKMLKYNDSLYGVAEADERGTLRYKFYTLHLQGYLTKSFIPIFAHSNNLGERLINYKNSYLNYFMRKIRLMKNVVKKKLNNIRNSNYMLID